MSRPHSLTDSQRRAIRRLKILRLSLIRQLKELPSRAELAREFQVSERTIGRELGADDQITQRSISLKELMTS